MYRIQDVDPERDTHAEAPLTDYSNFMGQTIR